MDNNSNFLTQTAWDVVNRTLASFPGPVREAASQVSVSYEMSPAPAVLAEGFESTILGLFSGSTLYGFEEEVLGMPALIHLYLENIWTYARGDIAVYQREVKITYLHELGHYLGWDETEIEARGLE